MSSGDETLDSEEAVCLGIDPALRLAMLLSRHAAVAPWSR